MEARCGSNSAMQESTVLDRNGRRGSPRQALPLTFRTGSAEELGAKHCALFTVQALHCLVVLRCRALQSHPLLAHQSSQGHPRADMRLLVKILILKIINTILRRIQMCMGLLILCSAANELIFANICTLYSLYISETFGQEASKQFKEGG